MLQLPGENGNKAKTPDFKLLLHCLIITAGKVANDAGGFQGRESEKRTMASQIFFMFLVVTHSE